MAEEYKKGKVPEIVREFDNTGNKYEINGIDQSKCKFFWRKENDKFQIINSGSYRITQEGGTYYLLIEDDEILTNATQFQICYFFEQQSSAYVDKFPELSVAVRKINDLVEDVKNIFSYLKSTGVTGDTSTMSKVLSELEEQCVWWLNNGRIESLPITEMYSKFDRLVKQLRQEVLELLEQDLEVAERELLEGVKTQLDEYVETDLKQRLDDYTTQLEERLQTMIDQAVADKGLMPEDSDWFEIALGNWLVVDLFNKNYIHYPSQLNSSDNAGVVKKDITDGGKSQILRYYTTTGKMVFAVRVNEVWSEWQELGEQTDTMQFTQANHGFIFTAVTLDGATRKWVKANKYTSADGIAIKIDNDRFDVVTRGVVNIPTSARDDKGEPFVYDEYYFLSQEVDGGLSRTKNEIGTFQYLAHISEIDNKQVAYIDIGDSYDLDYEVVDTETSDRVGIGTYKTTLRTADTIEDLKRLNLKEGDVIEVLGYYTKGDGADHKRKIENSDDGSGVLLNNSLYANIVHDNYIQASWFGAFSSNNTDYKTNETQKALDYFRDYAGNLILDFNQFLWVNNKLECIWNKGDAYNKELRGTIRGEFDNLQEVFFKFGIEMSEYGNISNKSLKLKVSVTKDCKAILKLYTQGRGNLAFWHSYFDLELSARRGYGLWVCNGFFENRIDRLNVNLMRKGYTWELVELGEESICYVLENQKGENIISSIKHSFINLWGGYNSIVTTQTGGTYAPTFTADEVHIFDTVSNGMELNNQGSDGNYINLVHAEFIGSKKANKPSYAVFWNGNGRISKFEGGTSNAIDDYMVGFLRVYNQSNGNFIIESSLKAYAMPDKIAYIMYNGRNYNKLILLGAEYKLDNTGDVKVSDFSECYIDTPNYLAKIQNLNINELFDKRKGYSLQNYGVKDRLAGFVTKIDGLQFVYTTVQNYETDDNKLKGYYLKFNNNQVPDNIYNSLGFFTKLMQRRALNASTTETAIQLLGQMFFDLGIATELQGTAFTPSVLNEVLSLDTPSYKAKMEAEGRTVLSDYYTTLDEIRNYNKEQDRLALEELERNKVLFELYQQELETNPNLTYEEFIAKQPIVMSIERRLEEPTIPQSVQEFMKKYL